MKVKLPMTGTRKSESFLKLLDRVAPSAVNGFQFEGRLLRPGGAIEETELPERALVLEASGISQGRGAGRTCLWLLWQFDREYGDWHELMRVWARSWEWTVYIGPVAERILHPVQPVPDLIAVAHRVLSAINTEFAPLTPRQRAQVAGVLHDRFASEIVRELNVA